MKIIPHRTMSLEGERVEVGKVVAVSAEAGALAIRHGWAVEVKAVGNGKARAATADQDQGE